MGNWKRATRLSALTLHRNTNARFNSRELCFVVDSSEGFCTLGLMQNNSHRLWDLFNV